MSSTFSTLGCGRRRSSLVRPHKHAMRYKIACPSCGAKLSRWHWIFSAIYYRCRSCGILFGMTALGWAVYLTVVAVEIFWYALCRLHFISSYVAIVLVVVTCAFGVWLLPYLTPVQFRRQAEPQNM
jgi:hypothetical protein